MQYADFRGGVMNIHDELDRAAGAVRTLESAVLGLRARLGTHIDVQRLADDVVRCAADLSRLGEDTVTGRSAPACSEPIIVPDEAYDVALWADGDVDDEGLGVAGRRAP
jgi:hypothetical protein